MKEYKIQTISMNDFQLKWRWVDILSDDELSQIEPLTKQTAALYHDKSSSLIDNEKSKPSKLFQKIEQIENNKIEQIQIWLKKRIKDNHIILSWSKDTAIIVTANLFIKKWDDFCYPSSDDITIFSDDLTWIILYHHSEIFWYGEY